MIAFRSFSVLFKVVRRTAITSALAASLGGCHPLPTAQFDSTNDPVAAIKPPTTGARVLLEALPNALPRRRRSLPSIVPIPPSAATRL